MKKVLLFAAASLAFSFSAVAQLSCDTLRDEIANKIINNGVPESGFRLDIVPMENAGQTEGQIVGSCGGGTSNIIYTRFRNGEVNMASPEPEATQSSERASEYNTQSRSVTGESLTNEMDTIIDKSHPAQTTNNAMINE